MTAPTTRETADHAELLTAKACGDRMLTVAEALMPWLKNYPPSTRRERAIEAANAAIAASCAPLLSEIAALRSALDVCNTARLHWELTVVPVLAIRLTQAERQRDELRKALSEIRDEMAASREEISVDDWIEFADMILANQGADQ